MAPTAEPFSYQIKSSEGMRAAGIVLLAVMFCVSSLGEAQASPGSIPNYEIKIINIYPHDKTAFTQGLVYQTGELYEGTGLYGQSTLRRVDLETGRVLRQINLSDKLFAEGVAIWKDRLIQLTWQSGIGLVYDKENMTQIGDFRYPTEGWGITSDGRQLIMSDGTETLHFLDPETFQEQSTIEVQLGGHPVNGLNELEYVNGKIFANVWPTPWIAIISPETGDVLGRMDLSRLRDTLIRETGQKMDVLNGIAYDAEKGRLFVTGKYWPRLFEIELVPGDGAEDK